MVSGQRGNRKRETRTKVGKTTEERTLEAERSGGNDESLSPRLGEGEGFSVGESDCTHHKRQGSEISFRR